MLDNKFYERIEKIYSKEDLDILKDWINTKKRPVSFRVNTLKSDNTKIEESLKENNISFEKVSFLDWAYTLTSWIEKDLWELDIYKNWEIYLQNISSLIPVTLLDLEKNDRVLDITAAPWSKTTQMSAIMCNMWEIVACEQNQIRMDKLKHNISKLWANNIKTVKTDARKLKDFFEEWYFDKILADLPCSSEWRINLSNEKTYSFWNEANIKRNYNLQKDIIKNTINLLKPGWTLVYSTCTIAPEENEAVVHFILSNYKDMKLEDIEIEFKHSRDWIKSFWKNIYNKEITKTKRIIPSNESEWFFIAKFKKDIIT